MTNIKLKNVTNESKNVLNGSHVVEERISKLVIY